MINVVELELFDGVFSIESGNDFSVISDDAPVLRYVENSTAYVKCNPERGRMNDVKIIVPEKTQSINIKISDGALRVYPIVTGIAKLEIKDSAVEIERLEARRIIATLGRGQLNMHALPAVGAVFECGIGTADIFLMKNRHGYAFDTMCGAGNLNINSKSLGRHFHAYDGVTIIKAKCGLGTMNISY